jgi:hypothetical protein
MVAAAADLPEDLLEIAVAVVVMVVAAVLPYWFFRWKKWL